MLDECDENKQGLNEYIPKRAKSSNTKPGITNFNVLGMKTGNEKLRIYSKKVPSRKLKQIIFVNCLSIEVQTLLSHHTYTFDGENLLQQGGSPVGLSESGDSA